MCSHLGPFPGLLLNIVANVFTLWSISRSVTKHCGHYFGQQRRMHEFSSRVLAAMIKYAIQALMQRIPVDAEKARCYRIIARPTDQPSIDLNSSFQCRAYLTINFVFFALRVYVTMAKKKNKQHVFQYFTPKQ